MLRNAGLSSASLDCNYTRQVLGRRQIVKRFLVALCSFGVLSCTATLQDIAENNPVAQSRQRQAEQLQFDRDQAEAERQRQQAARKQQEEERERSQREEYLKENPWVKLSEPEIAALARRNNIYPFHVDNGDQGPLRFMGADMRRMRVHEDVTGIAIFEVPYTFRPYPAASDAEAEYLLYFLDCRRGLLATGARIPDINHPFVQATQFRAISEWQVEYPLFEYICRPE